MYPRQKFLNTSTLVQIVIIVSFSQGRRHHISFIRPFIIAFMEFLSRINTPSYCIIINVRTYGMSYKREKIFQTSKQFSEIKKKHIYFYNSIIKYNKLVYKRVYFLMRFKFTFDDLICHDMSCIVLQIHTYK